VVEKKRAEKELRRREGETKEKEKLRCFCILH